MPVLPLFLLFQRMIFMGMGGRRVPDVSSERDTRKQQSHGLGPSRALPRRQDFISGQVLSQVTRQHPQLSSVTFSLSQGLSHFCMLSPVSHLFGTHVCASKLLFHLQSFSVNSSNCAIFNIVRKLRSLHGYCHKFKNTPFHHGSPLLVDILPV